MFSASTDLIAIVQSQMTLIAQTLGVVSSVMYVAQESPEGESQWVELVSYPQGIPASLPPRLLPTSREVTSIVRQERIVIPLVYEEVMLGLLVSQKSQIWTSQEQHQIEEVAHTLSIACAIDQRSQWLLNQQQEIRNLALSQQQDFLANLLHQLRNPLAALRTFGQLLLKRILPDDPNHRFVSGIVRETAHLQELLVGAEELPSLPPCQSTNFLLPAAIPQWTDLSEILEPLISSIGAIAQEKQIYFQALLPDLPIAVLSYPSGLREALLNLLDNALKYTSVAGKILLLVNVEPEVVTIQICDTGMGIPTNDLPRLFNRNFRGKQSQGPIGGSGLGLAIAKELIEQMQGTIGVESEEGQGSTFTVRLLRQPYPSHLLPQSRLSSA